MRALLFIITVVLSFPGLAQLNWGDQAPMFSLQKLENETVLSLTDYHGKVVYVDFWASWCGACLHSFPVLDSLKQEYSAQGFEIIGVNLDEDIQLAEAFLAKHPVSFPSVRGFNDTQLAPYDVQVLPVGYLVSAQGKVLLVNKGFSPKHTAFLRAVIEKAVSELLILEQ